MGENRFEHTESTQEKLRPGSIVEFKDIVFARDEPYTKEGPRWLHRFGMITAIVPGRDGRPVATVLHAGHFNRVRDLPLDEIRLCHSENTKEAVLSILRAGIPEGPEFSLLRDLIRKAEESE